MNASVEMQYADPVPFDPGIELPDSRADGYDFANPVQLWRFFRAIFGRRQQVELPESLPGRELVPKYALMEFHGLPNGYYSNRLSRGYITGFDRSMLGEMDRVRDTLAERLKGAASVLDTGSAGGKTAHRIKTSGVPEVWGLDPCPYLLKHAASDFPEIRFVQGIVEHIPFVTDRFDGLSACFLMHEMPTRSVRLALAEFARVVRSGGRVVIVEPSPVQFRNSFRRMWGRHGWKGVYFRMLAKKIYDPFLRAWHRFDIETEARDAGLEVEDITDRMPVRFITLAVR